MTEPSPELDPEGAEPGFRVTDLSSATWAMARVREARKAQQEVLDVAQAEMVRINRWVESAATPYARRAEYFESLLAAYARERRVATDGREKSVSTPYGRVSTSSRAAKLVVVDPDAFIAWADKYRPMAIERKPRILLSRLGDVSPDEATLLALDTISGEMVPGLSVEAATINVTFKIEE